MEVGVARGGVGFVGGRRKMASDGGCSRRKTTAGVVASLGRLAGDSGSKSVVNEEDRFPGLDGDREW
jgi:hypothetical protein